VLVAPHHGSSEDLTPAFLAAVQPQMILSSNFGRLTNKQKRFETMVGRTPLYRTPECGAITVTIHKDGTISVSTFVKNAKPK
jgi:beta-lactamase superfamily II metal-dependent hydrolase